MSNVHRVLYFIIADIWSQKLDCVKEDEEFPAMGNFTLKSAHMTVAYCIRFCRVNQWTYAGLRVGVYGTVSFQYCKIPILQWL